MKIFNTYNEAFEVCKKYLDNVENYNPESPWEVSLIALEISVPSAH